MCTLTFIPSKNNVVITSNRDEHISRGDTDFPVKTSSANGQIYFPQDPLAGGTWLAADTNNRVAVLLNGAFEKHKHQPPYKISRGLMLLHSFDYSNLKQFTSQYDFLEIEPFTMIQFDLTGKNIGELRWDGEQTHYKELPFSTAHIWSSSTLYSKEIRLQREKWFKEWIQDSKTSANRMLDFHKFGGSGATNSIPMNRGNGLQTVSISQITYATKNMRFAHHNLVQNSTKEVMI